VPFLRIANARLRNASCGFYMTAVRYTIERDFLLSLLSRSFLESFYDKLMAQRLDPHLAESDKIIKLNVMAAPRNGLV